MRNRLCAGGLFLVLVATAAQAQSTGYADHFDGASLKSGWAGSAQYGLSLDSGAMKIAINKNDRWQGLYLDLGASYNFSANPIVNLKIRGNVPFILYVYFIDTNNKNILIGHRVHQVSGLQNVCYDMSKAALPTGFDMTKIHAMIFAFNGNGKSLYGTAWFDDLLIGSSASRFANLRAIPALRHYQGTAGHVFQLTDIDNASSLTIGASTLLQNVTLSAISNGTARLSYDCKAGVSGSEALTVTAVGTGGFVNGASTFTLTVDGNHTPTVDPVPTQEIPVGGWQTVTLTGVTDGDPSAEQPLTLTATSDHPTALPSSRMRIAHDPGSPYATLTYLAAAPAAGAKIIVTVDDGQAVNHATNMTFAVNAYARFNHAPTLDAMADRIVKLDAGRQTFTVTGVGDGDRGAQHLTFSAASSATNVLPPAAVTFAYTSGASATLSFTPHAAGQTTVTVTLADDGAGTDNGPRFVQRSFTLQVLSDLPTGYVDPLTNLAAWDWSGTYSPSIVTFDGAPAIRAVCNNKWYWDGYTLNFPTNLDLSSHPYVSMEVYSVTKPTLHWMWFYDDHGIRNINVGAMDKAVWAPAGQWTTVRFDFSGAGEMQDSDGTPLNAQTITQILFNMHDSASAWPLPANYSGTYYLRNLRVGSDADRGTPSARLDGIADQALFQGAGPQRLLLSGIGDGNGGKVTPTLSLACDNTALIPSLTASPVAGDGTAALDYSPAAGTGRATVTVTVHAAGSLDASDTFTIDVVSAQPSQAQTATLDATHSFQTLRGFGTYQFPDKPQYVDLYTHDLGATAVRIGLIGNQIEPVNDNWDSNVLNRAGFDYSGLDFAYLKRLKDQGVQTFILTSWSPPAWMKDNLSVDYGYATVQSWEGTDNRLALIYYDEFAESMVAAVRLLHEQAGIDLAGIGLQNESAFCEPYPSAIMSPDKFARLIRSVGKRFADEGIHTRLYMPEQVFSQGFYSMQQFIDAVQADPIANRYTAVIATHGYADDGVQPGQPDFSQWTTMWNNAQEGAYPKELWMTETYPEGGTWDEALSLAGAIYGALEFGHVSLWTSWSIDGQLLRNGTPLPSFYAAKHYYKFLKPGFRRVASTSTHQDLLVTAYRSGSDDAFAEILINKGTTSMSVRQAGNGLPPTWSLYVSSEDRNFEREPDVTNGLFVLPPRSVATLYGRPVHPGTLFMVGPANMGGPP